jgi:cellulose synthase/poly-beta-1,6-N-acetylglucosamine synthase-like glycosyltransferase
VLGRQRDRWQRGLLETLWRHRAMLLRPRYGGVGMVGLPFFLLFEAAGPIIELCGIVYCFAGLLLGWVSPAFGALLLAMAFTYGLVLSFGALLIEGRAFARYPGWKDLRRLMVAAVVENFGYRQWLAYVRTRATLRVLGRKQHGWGEMTRVGFGEPVAQGISSRPPG